MNWSTKVTEILGCKYPIIEGAFGGFGTAALAAPVSDAGGFGMITASALKTPERLREDIRKAKSMTDKPFGVNLSVGASSSINEMLDVALDEDIPAIFTAVYRADDIGKRVHEAGRVWIHKVATVRHAFAAERHGADAIIIVGMEGTGFKSVEQLPTLIGITNAVKAIDKPIIAAGGIGDARGMLGALGMGAEAIYMGTRFMAVEECPISPRYKRKLVESQPWDPKVRDRILNVSRNEEYEKILKLKGTMPQDEWLRMVEKQSFKRSSELNIDWQKDYDEEVATHVTGGSLAVGVIDSVVSCKELIDNIIRDAEAVLAKEGNIGKLML
ncbi:MAG: nitronate monooxygenase [Chloroflexota bacterium]|nr:nitronate monooxygenase [Chloroflexota bacterium]